MVYILFPNLLSHLILMTTFQDKYYYLLFKDEDTDAQNFKEFVQGHHCEGMAETQTQAF